MVRKSFISSLTNRLPTVTLVVLIFVVCCGCTMVTGGGPFFRVQKHDSLVVVEMGAKLILQEVDGSADDIATGKLWTEEVGRVAEAGDSAMESAAR